MSDAPTLVVGGTGKLGGQVVSALLQRDKRVRALVRPSSDASGLEARGVEVVPGDMMDPPSLLRAMDGVGAVVTTAAGYTRHSKGDTPDIDVVGNRNLVDAAAKVGVERFVLTSILTCDQTPDVPHFWHKKETEDRLEELGVPFVALRPGAFLDQVAQTGGDAFAKGRLSWIGSKTIPLTFVLIADVAGYLADATTADVGPATRIDIGWTRPLSIQEVADISSRVLGKEIKVRAVPMGVVRTAGRALRPVAPFVTDMSAMFDWFQTGGYVADTSAQQKVFGAVPTPEEAIERYIKSRSTS